MDGIQLSEEGKFLQRQAAREIGKVKASFLHLIVMIIEDANPHVAQHDVDLPVGSYIIVGIGCGLTSARPSCKPGSVWLVVVFPRPDKHKPQCRGECVRVINNQKRVTDQ